MTWFLQLFGTFRVIVEKHLKAEAECELLRAQLEAERAARAELERELSRTLKDTVDAFSRQATGRNVFARASGDGFVIAPQVEARQIPQRRFASDVARQRTAEVFRQASQAGISETMPAQNLELEELVAGSVPTGSAEEAR